LSQTTTQYTRSFPDATAGPPLGAHGNPTRPPTRVCAQGLGTRGVRSTASTSVGSSAPVPREAVKVPVERRQVVTEALEPRRVGRHRQHDDRDGVL